MTFLELQEAVLADAFDEIKRADAKRWINARYSWIVDYHEWTFKNTTDAVTITAGSQIVTGIPATFGVALGLFLADGTPLTEIGEYKDFAALYVGTNNNQSGVPEAYCAVGSSIFVGPTPTATQTGLLVFEQDAAPLVDDMDVPILPANYHVALVHGAKAEGFKLSTVPGMAADLDADFQAYLTAMQRRYLVASRVAGQQVPAYRPGG